MLSSDSSGKTIVVQAQKKTPKKIGNRLKVFTKPVLTIHYFCNDPLLAIYVITVHIYQLLVAITVVLRHKELINTPK